MKLKLANCGSRQGRRNRYPALPNPAVSKKFLSHRVHRGHREKVKIFKTITVWLVAGMIIYGTGRIVQAYQRQINLLQARVQQAEEHIPTIMELQQLLLNKGYKLKIDGRLGPETKKAWKREINNQYAAEYFKPRR